MTMIASDDVEDGQSALQWPSRGLLVDALSPAALEASFVNDNLPPYSGRDENVRASSQDCEMKPALSSSGGCDSNNEDADSGSSSDSDDEPLAKIVKTKKPVVSPSDCKVIKKQKKSTGPMTPSAYSLFAHEHELAVKSQNPNARRGEITKIIRSMWKDKDTKARKVYTDAAKLARQAHKAKMQDCLPGKVDSVSAMKEVTIPGSGSDFQNSVAERGATGGVSTSFAPNAAAAVPSEEKSAKILSVTSKGPWQAQASEVGSTGLNNSSAAPHAVSRVLSLLKAPGAPTGGSTGSQSVDGSSSLHIAMPAAASGTAVPSTSVALRKPGHILPVPLPSQSQRPQQHDVGAQEVLSQNPGRAVDVRGRVVAIRAMSQADALLLMPGQRQLVGQQVVRHAGSTPDGRKIVVITSSNGLDKVEKTLRLVATPPQQRIPISEITGASISGAPVATSDYTRLTMSTPAEDANSSNGGISDVCVTSASQQQTLPLNTRMRAYNSSNRGVTVSSAGTASSSEADSTPWVTIADARCSPAAVSESPAAATLAATNCVSCGSQRSGQGSAAAPSEWAQWKHDEYCSSQCLISHCRDVFSAWITTKHGLSAT